MVCIVAYVVVMYCTTMYCIVMWHVVLCGITLYVICIDIYDMCVLWSCVCRCICVWLNVNGNVW